MQVIDANNVSDTIVVSTNNKQDFVLDNNGSLFDILSDGLYSNKIQAVVREILCNGWDSHINNNVNIPLEITLNNNEIIFRDFGSGIEPSKIIDIYCTYGKSTKVQDEKQTGGFGLGSKSPFAYTDIFYVTNFFGNIKTTYILNKEPHQPPTLNTVVSTNFEKNDNTGLEVRIPFKQKDDSQKFLKEIQTFLKKSEIKVFFNGQLWENNYDFNNKFLLLKQDIGFKNFQLEIKYGSVSYKIDSDYIEKFVIIRPNCHLNTLILQAEPDTLTVTPSRESLAHTDLTNKTIDTLIDDFILKIQNNLFNRVKEIFDSFKTFKDYFEFIDKIESLEFLCTNNDLYDYIFYSFIHKKLAFDSNYNISQIKLQKYINYRFKLLCGKYYNTDKYLYTFFGKIIKAVSLNTVKFVSSDSNKNTFTESKWDKLPNFFYVLTQNRSIKTDSKFPVILCKKSEKNNIIQHLTNLGFKTEYIPDRPVERNTKHQFHMHSVIVCKIEYYKPWFNNFENSYWNFNLNDIDKCYIIHNDSKFLHSNFFGISVKELLNKDIIIIKYISDYKKLIKQGFKDFEQEIINNDLLNKYFDIKFLKKFLHQSVSNYDCKKYNFIEQNKENNYKLLRYTKHKKHLIDFYDNYKKIHFLNNLPENIQQQYKIDPSIKEKYTKSLCVDKIFTHIYDNINYNELTKSIKKHETYYFKSLLKLL